MDGRDVRSNRDKVNEALDLLRDVTTDECMLTRSRERINNALPYCNTVNCAMCGKEVTYGYKCRLIIARKVLGDLIFEDVLND